MSFLVTASLFFAILIIAGGAWLIRGSGARSHARVTSAALQTEGTEEGAAPVNPIAQLKRLVQAGESKRALPSLLVITGLLGVMHFGALALIFVFNRPAAGIPMLAVALFATARIALDYYRA